MGIWRALIQHLILKKHIFSKYKSRKLLDFTQIFASLTVAVSLSLSLSHTSARARTQYYSSCYTKDSLLVMQRTVGITSADPKRFVYADHIVGPQTFGSLPSKLTCSVWMTFVINEEMCIRDR